MTKKTKAQRRRESHARKHAKVSEASAQATAIQTREERDEPDETNGGSSGFAALSKEPAVPGQSKTDEADSSAKKGPNWMRVLMAVWRGMRWIFSAVVGFLGRNNGAVTALATVVIAVLTSQYVAYSKKQWETSNRQLGDFEASQAAQLVFEDFNPTLNPDPTNKDCLVVDGTFTVSNLGPTIARDIYIHPGPSSIAQVVPLAAAGTYMAPTPIPNGPSLAPTKQLIYGGQLMACANWTKSEQVNGFSATGWLSAIGISSNDRRLSPSVSPLSPN